MVHRRWIQLVQIYIVRGAKATRFTRNECRIYLLFFRYFLYPKVRCIAVALSCLRSSPAFTVDRYSVQKTPHVDWNGTRYGRGMNLKFTNCRTGQTVQLVRRVGMNMSEYFCDICFRERPSSIPMDPMKATSPMGAMTIWSAATRLAKAFGLILPVPLRARSGNCRSRNPFHRPRKGLMEAPKTKKRRVRRGSKGLRSSWGCRRTL